MDWEWSDLRHFLAVARAGTTLRAARELGVSQTTCARRIDALEKALDARLFERTPAGYVLTASGAALVPYGEAVEAGALAFAREARERTQAERRIIRFSTSDILAELIARSAVASFAVSRPDIRVELNVDSRIVDLAGEEHDVALRADRELRDPALIARKLCPSSWAMYCGLGYASLRTPPASLPEALGHPLAMLAGQPVAIVRQIAPNAELRHVSNSMSALLELIAKGEVVGALPMLIGDRRKDLIRCCPVDLDGGSIWIVYHERLRGAPHVRAFVDHVAVQFETWLKDTPVMTSLKDDDGG